MEIFASCLKGKHKFRENKFGVVWCVNCGLISIGNFSAPSLQEHEIRIYKNDKL